MDEICFKGMFDDQMAGYQKMAWQKDMWDNVNCILLQNEQLSVVMAKFLPNNR